MTYDQLSTIQVAAAIATGMVSISLFLTFIRLVRGPSLPDRVIALDLIGVLAVGIIVAYSIFVNQPVLLDPAAMLALVGFLGTAAFARYLERQARDE